MVKISDEIVSLIAKEDNVVVLASVNTSGIPNISPRYVMMILDDEKLVFADLYMNKTFANIKKWSKVAVAIVDKANRGGFQLKGDVEKITDPNIIAQCTKKLKDLNFDSIPIFVWALGVREIYSIAPSALSKIPLFSVYG